MAKIKEPKVVGCLLCGFRTENALEIKTFQEFGCTNCNTKEKEMKSKSLTPERLERIKQILTEQEQKETKKMLKNCNCSNYCFACVSQHSAFESLVWSVTEKALEYVYNEAQKKVKTELWQDNSDAPQLMENAINEAVANVLYYSMTPDEINELTN